MNAKANLMTEGPIRKKLIGFAFPLFLGNLFQQLYNAVDSLIVGNFAGSNALAAVSSAGNLIFLFVGFFNGISMGAGVVIARFIGAEDKKNTEIAVHTTVMLGLISSLLMTVVGVGLTPWILKMMSTPDVVYGQSVMYFRVYFAGSLGFVMYNVFMGILQASGDSKHPLYYLMFSSLINVVLDLILIVGFHMGVGAAAFATVMSQLSSALLCLRRLMRVEADYRIVFKKLGMTAKMTKRILNFGLPSGLQNSIMAFSNVVIQSYINSFGELAMAGIGAYVKVEGFMFIPVTSFCMAITTFVSQNVGAGKMDRMKKGVFFGAFCTLATAEVMGVLLFVFAEPLVRMFDSNPDVIFYGVERAHIVTLFFFMCAFTHFMSAVLRGIGKPMVPMYVFLFCWCVARVLILTISSLYVHTIYMTYVVYPITWTISSVVLILYYLFLKKKETRA